MATRAKHHPEVNRTELAAKIAIDRGYLTNLLNGHRRVPLKIALGIFKETGLQLGPLKGKSKRDIETLELANAITGGSA